jgi:hypothetical protein
MTDSLLAAGLTAEGTRTHDALLAGDFPRSTRVVTLTGGPYTRGTLLGNITATNKRKQCLAASNDGSQTPECILAADADGSAADVQAIVYLTGEFNSAAMTIDGGLTLATVKEQLRKIGIFLRGIVAA